MKSASSKKEDWDKKAWGRVARGMWMCLLVQRKSTNSHFFRNESCMNKMLAVAALVSLKPHFD